MSALICLFVGMFILLLGYLSPRAVPNAIANFNGYPATFLLYYPAIVKKKMQRVLILDASLMSVGLTLIFIAILKIFQLL